MNVIIFFHILHCMDNENDVGGVAVVTSHMYQAISIRKQNDAGLYGAIL